MGYRDRIVPFVNYFYLHKKGLGAGKSQEARAAEMIRAVREFRDMVETEVLEPEKVKGQPMDTSSYIHMFGTSRVPSKPSDTFHKYPRDETEHVIVMRKNRFFKVDTRNRGAKEIEAALKQIKETVGKQEGLAVGALTSENRDVWADLRDHLVSLSPGNAEALKEIGIFDQPKEVAALLPIVKELQDGEPEASVQVDDYLKYKKLEKQLEHLDVMEEYIKLETGNLEKELLHAQEEVKRIQSVPLVIGQFLEAVDQDHAIVGSTTGSNYFVRVLSILDRELLKPGCSVALHKYSNALVDVLPPEADSSIQMLRPDEKPEVSYADIGGMDMQKQEVREAVELPLTHGELYQQIGIDPPRGVLMYGPPGCGKTMLAKAVAAHTTASFIRVVGSEFVQKYLGEGPRMVRDVFRLAKENSPSIIFIDEIDAIATKRFDAQTGADREVQRILLELLNQMDGFDQTTNVKVIMATNRQDTLDPALLRPGRLDRKIEFPIPDRRQKRMIFSTIGAKMNLSDEVDTEDFVARPDKISGADINSICQEAGMHAVRENRYVVLTKDFEKAYKSVVKKDQNDFEFYK